MIALRQIKRVPKNHKIVIEVPDTIQENQIMGVILLCKELPENDKSDKIAQLNDSQHDPLFLSDMKAISDDFIGVDSEAWQCAIVGIDCGQKSLPHRHQLKGSVNKKNWSSTALAVDTATANAVGLHFNNSIQLKLMLMVGKKACTT